MIESIKIKSVASFGDVEQVIGGLSIGSLSKNNFFYGANGSGKTTISRVIADSVIADRVIAGEDEYSECSVTWLGGNKLKTFVYNRDFVDKNFNSDTDLQGIFTLGEKNKTDIKAIEDANAELDKLDKDIQDKDKTLRGEDGGGGKENDLKNLENEFKGQCWILKRKYDKDFKEAFKGFMRKAKFKAKFLKEVENNKANLEALEELKVKYNKVFADNPKKMDSILPLQYFGLVGLETEDILAKKVIGKDDVDIAAMIKKLGNSDWVKQGLDYYEKSGDPCPFCQQDTNESFADDLTKYFDEAYSNDLDAIKQLATNYEEHSTAIIQHLQSIVDVARQYPEWDFDLQKSVVETKISANKQHIERKKKEVSRVVELESLEKILYEISLAIKSTNEKIEINNKTVDNIEEETRNLISQIWKYIVEEGKSVHDSYIDRKISLKKVIDSLDKEIADKEVEKKKKIDDISALKEKNRSIQPTIDGINKLLSLLDFTGFKIEESDEKDGYYRIARPDGSEAKETLSEGERSFITFLYFYHLLKESTSESGTPEDSVVVIDDPVSSLDSDTLFVVSNLIRDLLVKVRSDIDHIKQVFVLTHNVYFHKEITFKQKRVSDKTFWIVKKNDKGSVIENYKDNPVKTSYGLLWNKVKEAKDDKHSILTLQNTLRRILENYFIILGNINSDKITGKFKFKEKKGCEVLFSWLNAGSHCALDDLYVSCDAETVDRYLDIFKEIFEMSGHIAHYNMMMGTTEEPDTPEEANDNPQ